MEMPRVKAGSRMSAAVDRMSLHIFSDKSVTGDKSTENCDFLFSPPELTGRSSVLRLSQKENVPPKSTAKTVKVSTSGPCVRSVVCHTEVALPPAFLAT